MMVNTIMQRITECSGLHALPTLPGGSIVKKAPVNGGEEKGVVVDIDAQKPENLFVTVNIRVGVDNMEDHQVVL